MVKWKMKGTNNKISWQNLKSFIGPIVCVQVDKNLLWLSHDHLRIISQLSYETHLTTILSFYYNLMIILNNLMRILNNLMRILNNLMIILNNLMVILNNLMRILHNIMIILILQSYYHLMTTIESSYNHLMIILQS